MNADELRARLVDLALRQRRAERRGEHELAAQLEAEYTALQPAFGAMLDAMDTMQGRLEDVG